MSSKGEMKISLRLITYEEEINIAFLDNNAANPHFHVVDVSEA